MHQLTFDKKVERDHSVSLNVGLIHHGGKLHRYECVCVCVCVCVCMQQQKYIHIYMYKTILFTHGQKKLGYKLL